MPRDEDNTVNAERDLDINELLDEHKELGELFTELLSHGAAGPHLAVPLPGVAACSR